MPEAKFIMKNRKINHTEDVWHYIVVSADGRDLKDVFLTPDEVKAEPEYAELQSISPVQWHNLKTKGTLTNV